MKKIYVDTKNPQKKLSVKMQSFDLYMATDTKLSNHYKQYISLDAISDALKENHPEAYNTLLTAID